MTDAAHAEPRPVEAGIPAWEVVLASLFGGVFVGLADVLFNREPVTFRIAEVARRVVGEIAFSVTFETIAFAVILGLGLGLCFVYRPRTRVGAFGRGSSVIAVLAGMNIAVPAVAKAEGVTLTAETPVSSCEPRAYGVFGLGTLIHGDAKACWATGLVAAPVALDCVEKLEVGDATYCRIRLPGAAAESFGWVRE